VCVNAFPATARFISFEGTLSVTDFLARQTICYRGEMKPPWAVTDCVRFGKVSSPNDMHSAANSFQMCYIMVKTFLWLSLQPPLLAVDDSDNNSIPKQEGYVIYRSRKPRMLGQLIASVFRCESVRFFFSNLRHQDWA
jgi:hypothetical protein